MKPIRLYERWTHPEKEMPAAYCRLSYALFLTDRRDGEIVASRCPDPVRLAVGNGFPGVLGLSEGACRFLWEDTSDPRPLFVLTDVGVGLLDKRYDRHAGIGLFFHIHGRPRSLARLINYGALGAPGPRSCFRVSGEVKALGKRVVARDEPSYKALTEAKDLLLSPLGPIFLRERPGRCADVLGEGILRAEDLCEGIREIAAFAGCAVELEQDGAPRRLACYRPLLLEPVLICALTQAAEVAVQGKAVCCVSTLNGEEEGGLRLSLRYAVDPAVPEGDTGRRMLAVWQHLAENCELSGLDLQGSIRLPTRSERRAGMLPEVCLAVEWQRDPALLPTSDLKADPHLRRG